MRHSPYDSLMTELICFNKTNIVYGRVSRNAISEALPPDSLFSTVCQSPEPPS